MVKDHNDPFYTVEYKTEDVIFRTGDDSPCMYAVLQGQVDLYKQTEAGEVQIKSVGPGSYIGVVSYLGETSRRCKAVASKNTRVQQLFEDNIEGYISENADSVVVLMDTLSRRLVEADKSLGQIGGIDKCVSLDDLACQIAQAIPEKNKVDKPVKKKVVAANKLNHDIYPEGHNHYEDALNTLEKEMFSDKNAKCPVCGQEFDLLQLRTSKFKLVRLERDLRQVFDGVDEIWYNVWTCPHCKYSNFHYDFPRMKSVNRQKLLDEMPYKLREFKVPKKKKTTYNEVFDSYYLAMACKEIVGGSAYEMGRLWLHLAWMYKDVEDKKMFRMAYENAREYYAKGWFSERIQLTPEGEQKLAILISEMHYHAGLYEDARKFVFEAVNINRGSKALKELARERLLEIKEVIRKK